MWASGYWAKPYWAGAYWAPLARVDEPSTPAAPTIAMGGSMGTVRINRRDDTRRRQRMVRIAQDDREIIEVVSAFLRLL